MNEPSNYSEPLEELRSALSEGDAVRPPRPLGELIVASAMEVRPPGRSSLDSSPINPSEAFARSVATLDRLLASLSSYEWHHRALRDLDVQALVGHLIGVELAFVAALENPDGIQGDADHITSTDALAHRQAAQSPLDTLRTWRAAAKQSLDWLETISTPTWFERTVPLHRIRLPLGALLVVRTFELWTHGEDIRRALGRPLDPPDPATLRLMTDVAFELLPGALERARIPLRRTCTRVVLTGPGGRTWETPTRAVAFAGHAPSPTADVRIVMDSVHFCRLIANRVDRNRVEAMVTGDRALAQELFTVAAGLALD
jgi:uncharacterized protein (TIGR03083 family)